MNRGVQICSLADLAGVLWQNRNVGHDRDSQVGQLAKGANGQITVQLGIAVTDTNRRGKAKQLSQWMHLM